MGIRLRPYRRDHFHIAIVCTLPLEFHTIALTLRKIWDNKHFGKAPGDPNTYTLGCIRNRDVVLALLHNPGESSAASGTAALHTSFPAIKFIVLTGICCGLPRAGSDNEVLLGDVVISNSVASLDFGRFGRIKDLTVDVLTPDGKPTSVAATLERHGGRIGLQNRAGAILHQIQVAARRDGQNLSRPPSKEDRLFESEYLHKHRDPHGCACSTNDVCSEAISASCDELHCDPARLVQRKRLSKGDQEDGIAEASRFQVFLGRVGLSATVMKSGSVRDKVAEQLDLIALDMEAEGILGDFPGVIVKGICDYADGHTNKSWQRYAAATAASTTAAIVDQIILPHRPRPTSIVPLRRNPSFIGRSEILDEVRRLLGHRESQREGCPLVVLHGGPGIGKTQIALEYVCWLQSVCPNVSVFWVVASDLARYRESYLSIAKGLGIPGYDDPAADVFALVDSWLESVYQEQWLMVIDDISSAGSVSVSLPQNSNGSFLMTTRDIKIVSWFVQQEQTIEVPRTSEGEAEQLLQKLLCDKASTEDIHMLSTLADSSPLSLEYVARFISDTNASVDQVLQFWTLNKDDQSRMLSPKVTKLEWSEEHLKIASELFKGWKIDPTNPATSGVKPSQSSGNQMEAFSPPSTDAGSSDTESDDSFGSDGQVFSEKLASTKLSSLDNEANMVEEADTTKPKAENFYMHQPGERHSRGDDEDEIQSLVSGVEDIQSQDGSGSVDWQVREAAVSYLAEMLASDPDLKPLYKSAAQRLEGERFVRNHGRLLKRYYLSLRSRASDQKQKVAIEFLRPRVHRMHVSIRIRENLEFQDTSREKVFAELPQDEGRDLTLDRYLSSVGTNTQDHPDNTVVVMPEVDEGSEDDLSEYEWGEEEDDGNTSPGLVSLEETRSFFMSGQPLVDFGTNFRDLLYPKPEVEEEAQPKTMKPKQSHVISRGAALLARLFDMWSPPKDGYKRVRYMCDCGEYTFMDVRELSPGGLERFRQRLARHGLSNIIAASAPTEFPDGLSPPPSAYLGTSRSPSVTSQSSGISSSRRSSLSTQPSSISWSEDEAPPQDEQTIPQYLLLCVNQKSLPELIHIDCRPFQNDQYLCQQILKEYQITRDKSTWRPSLLLHAKLLAMLSGVSSFLKYKTPRWLEWLFRLSRSVFEISFFQMDTGDFVRFQLVPVGELTVPNHFKCAEFPPESEVKAGNYEYEPVPMIDVAIASIPLWHLTRPVQHSDMYWIKTFPKKMRSPLYRQSGVYGKPVIGWGIRVNESFHWKHFLLLILAVSIGISIIVGIYVAVTSDASSAFGLGAFLAALVAIYIPHQYFAWKEKLN